MRMFKDFVVPGSLEEARAELQRLGPEGMPLAGATSLLFLRHKEPRVAVDLSRAGLAGIRADGSAFAIGAMTTIADLRRPRAGGWVLDRVAARFVTQQVAFHPAHAAGLAHLDDEVGGNVHQVGLHPRRLGHRLVDLIPGQQLVGGDVEGVPEGLLVAQQPHETLGEILRVGDRPDRGAVPVHNHRLAAAHAVHDGEVRPTPDGHRDHGIVGQGGTHDGHRETLIPISAHQPFLAGDLVAGVVPVRVGQRSVLRHHRVGQRFLVGGGRGDEDVLFRPAREQAQIALHVRGGKPDPVHHHIPGPPFQGAGRAGLVADVRHQGGRAGNAVVAGTAVQKGQLHPPLHRETAHRRADVSGPADKEYAHGQFLPRHPPGAGESQFSQTTPPGAIRHCGRCAKFV